MEKLSKFEIMLLFYFVTFVVLSFSPAATSLKAYDQVDESLFSYDPNNITGPANWGQVPEWFLCGNGTRQSPTDLKNAMSVILSRETQTILYNPSFASLVNRGHEITLTWEGNPGHIVINGTRYDLEQCHWHTPSEHALQGQRYDLEIHCVYESHTNRTAVVAVLYKIGQVSDPFLALLTSPLVALANGARQAPAGIIDPRQIHIDFSRCYRYNGSFTTPPCTEDIVWRVITQVKPVSRAQVKLLKEAVHDRFEFNARPLQPWNNRTVLLDYVPFEM